EDGIRDLIVTGVQTCALPIFLIYYEMFDDTQTASANFAVEKARTSAMFRRTSKELEDTISSGRVAVLGFPGATPVEGGLPIVVRSEERRVGIGERGGAKGVVC